MKIKKIFTIFMVVMMVMSLSACGSKNDKETTTGTSNEETSEGVQSEEKIVLRMAWWGSQTRHDGTVKVIEMYEAQNPNIDIEYEFYDFGGYITKLNTLVASDSVWDIFQLGGNFPTYLEKIEPLNDYIEQGIVDTSNTTEAFLSTTQYEGIQLALSSGVNTYGIAYDPQMFKDAGVPEPTENWTWEDYRTASLTIHEELGIYGSSKLSDFIAGCSMGVSQEDFALNFFAASNDQLGFDDPAMLVDYLTLRKELVLAGAYPDPGAIAEIKDIEGDYLVTGEAAMTWVASNQMPTLAEAAGREIKMTTVPRKKADGPSGAAIQSSQMFCLSNDSEAPEEAAKFMSFFVNDVEANKILNGERGVSIVSTVREELEKDSNAAKNEMYNYVSLVGGFETGEVNVISPSEQAEIEDQYDLLMAQVIFGEKTPEEAAAEMYDFSTKKFE